MRYAYLYTRSLSLPNILLLMDPIIKEACNEFNLNYNRRAISIIPLFPPLVKWGDLLINQCHALEVTDERKKIPRRKT